MKAYEVAAWLNNSDSTGATDEQFAEVFALLEKMMYGRRIAEIYDAEFIIKNMDVDHICNTLKTILIEIQQNV